MFLNNNAMFTLVIEGVFNDFDEVVYERLVTAIAHAEDIKYDPETEYCYIRSGEDIVWEL